MGVNAEKFKKICREKGLFPALLKTINYLVFLVHRSRLEKIWGEFSLKSGRLEIKGWNTGPKIYWDGVELTKEIGINTSIFVNGKWHDSSRARWKGREISPNNMLLENSWKTLPIKQTWVITNLPDSRVACEIKLETKKDMEFIEQKFTVMLCEKFNLWFDAVNKGKFFPQFKDWADIKEVKKEDDFIGAQSDIDRNFPTVIVRKIDLQAKVYPQIQNSDFKTRARLLNFVASSRDLGLRYKKGINTFFKMGIDVK